MSYPLVLQLAGRRVVVVGGGAVAVRRVRGLVEAGALVHVIAPAVAPAIRDLDVVVHERAYAGPSDLTGAWLVHACTDDPVVNSHVADDAEAAGIWCARADDATSSVAHVPAVAREAGVTVAVHAGGDPGRAVRVRNALAHALALGELPLRGVRQATGVGTVALVGGGPGDPGLITVRGRELLARADVVVVDKLAPRELLPLLDPDVEVIDAGKSPHRHNLTQAEIDELIVARARRGLRVVRLKGGDPFVFGRGGEEALACVRAGVPFEVVPGVTSAVAVPAYAGIPVTHRGLTQDFAVISAHLDPSQPGATVDWESLATGAGTLVLLMAVGTLEAIAVELVKRGRDAATPAAVISNGTLPDERVVVAPLESVAAAATRAGITAPAVVVVGEVVRLREQLHWR